MLKQLFESGPGRNDRWIATGLATLATQDALLLMAGWARLQPHPPEQVMPFIGALAVFSLRLALSARSPSRAGYVAALLLALLHLANFGPHKFLTPNGAQIAPMVVVGLLMIGQVAFAALEGLRGRNTLPVAGGAQ